MSTLDARTLPVGAHLSADVVVIGTGPSGMTVARELADTGRDILLLEGGSLDVDAELQDTLKGDAHSQRAEPLEKVRQKGLGGASHQWGGRTAPFSPLDFEARPGLGIMEPWPFSRQDLEAYYRRAAQALDLRRYEWDAATALPGDPEHLLGGGQDVVADTGIWRFSPPVRFGDVYRRELDHRANVRLLHHANVVRLITGEGGGAGDVELTQVVAASAPGRTFTVTGRIVVVATGGLEAARLLLHSEVGTAHDQVGRNYMIHPIAEVGELQLSDPHSADTATRYVKSHDGVWVRRLLTLTERVRREQDLLHMGYAIWYEDPMDPSHGDPLLSAYVLARKALIRLDGFKSAGMHRRFAAAGGTAQHVRNVALGAPQLAAFAYTWARDRWADPRTLPAFTHRSKQGRYRIRFDAEQSPSPENRVTLSRDERDAFGVPRLHVAHRVGDTDRENYHRSLTLLAEGFARSGFGTYTPPSLDHLLSLELTDATHQMGLVRTGTRPETSVVDPDLRVWGTRNLYISSTGVFPTASHAGPTMTAVAVATRLADHLRRRLVAGTGAVTDHTRPRREEGPAS